MKSLYDFVVNANVDKSFKELFMAPYADSPVITSGTKLVVSSRSGQTRDPCVDFPLDLDPDGSVKEAADRWGLKYTEDNYVSVKGVGAGER